MSATLMELIYSLVGFPNETEWLEFKENSNDAQEIGKDISALANTAAYLGRDAAYKVWGIQDSDHALTGTKFNPFTQKAKGNQDLQIWLQRMLTPNANYTFEEVQHGDMRFVVLKIHAAVDQPVRFQDAAYIRRGASTTKVQPASSIESELWRRLQRADFESRIALEDIHMDEISNFIDVDAYYTLCNIRQPQSPAETLPDLVGQGLVSRQDNGRLGITNLGLLLVGRNLSSHSSLAKRPLRVIRFNGDSNFEIIDDKLFNKGYALALPEAEEYLLSLLPAGERIDGMFRRIQFPFPQQAIRELLSNMVTHQDLSIATSGPMVGVYDDRLEFSNPGASLISPERILNAQPKTRNASLARNLRMMDLCEEGGTGWDIVVHACEQQHLAAPRMRSSEELGTQVTLFSQNEYASMTKQERLDAAYWHACLRYSQGKSMNNSTLRERFGLPSENKNTLAISRLIKECCVKGLIKEEDENASLKYKRYIPFWA